MFSSNASQVSNDAVFIEDTFSTTLYTGNGSTQTINNGIDLAGKGGLVWLKQRSLALNHLLMDSARGVTNYLSSNTTSAQTSGAPVTFSSTGLSIASGGAFWNQSSDTYASWTFRKQQKFFDCVTYTGNGTAGRQIAHNLGSEPGCIIVKATNSARSWMVYHRSTGATQYLLLERTDAAGTWSGAWNNTAPTSTNFTVGTAQETNGIGNEYVAYLFAHNAGGFGLSGTDNVISCGSFTTDASANASVTLGYEPQFVLYKRSSGASNWFMLDNMRGWNQTGFNDLKANLSDAENVVSGNFAFPTATGFAFTNSGSLSASSTYIYIAIRRGPMKTPTTGTSVFAPVANTQSSGTVRTIGFPADLAISTGRTTNLQRMFNDRLRGFSQTNTSTGPRLFSNTTDAETTSFTGVGAVTNTGYQDGDYFDPGISMIRYLFGRAPGFFDVVCYTGTGVARTVAHNLTVVPELMIVKSRSAAGYWPVYSAAIGNDYILSLDTTGAKDGPGAPQWNSTTPTASVFSLGASSGANASGVTFVNYLFASCPGVSKVGSYTGTGTTQQINCGFTAGARFVLIKRTDSTGDWYVWDTARGIVSGNDPYLLLNSTAAEVTNTDYVDTFSSGFEISSTAPAAINASGGTFIYLAIA